MGLFTPEREKSQEAKEGRDTSRRRDPMPRILVVSLVAAAVALVTYTTRQEGQPIEIALSAATELTDQGLLVRGETNLVDGAVLELWLGWNSAGGVPDREPDAEATVEGGSFSVLIAGEQEPVDRELQRVHLVFDPVRVSGPQDAEVLSVYGVFGENLGGGAVADTDRGKRIEVSIQHTPQQ